MSVEHKIYPPDKRVGSENKVFSHFMSCKQMNF